MSLSPLLLLMAEVPKVQPVGRSSMQSCQLACGAGNLVVGQVAAPLMVAVPEAAAATAPSTNTFPAPQARFGVWNNVIWPGRLSIGQEFGSEVSSGC